MVLNVVVDVLRLEHQTDCSALEDLSLLVSGNNRFHTKPKCTCRTKQYDFEDFEYNRPALASLIFRTGSRSWAVFHL